MAGYLASRRGEEIAAVEIGGCRDYVWPMALLEAAIEKNSRGGRRVVERPFRASARTDRTGEVQEHDNDWRPWSVRDGHILSMAGRESRE